MKRLLNLYIIINHNMPFSNASLTHLFPTPFSVCVKKKGIMRLLISSFAKSSSHKLANTNATTTLHTSTSSGSCKNSATSYTTDTFCTTIPATPTTSTSSTNSQKHKSSSAKHSRNDYYIGMHNSSFPFYLYFCTYYDIS